MSQLIIGHVSENSAKIWVRGSANNESTTTLTASITLKSDLQTISQNLTIYKHNNFVGIIEFTDLNPADSGFIRMMYTVDIVFKDIARVPIGFNSRGSFNTVPRVEYQLSFLLGSNLLQRTPDDGKRVFKNLINIRKKDKPAFMIHAGNQVYIDAPLNKNPIQSEDYIKKYSNAWTYREASEFFGRIANYNAINDHEIYFRFANDVEYDYKPGSYYLREALPAYHLFQHNRNPNNFGENKFYYSYNFAGSAFFVLDTRAERYQFVKQGQQRQMISSEQMEALKQWMLEHKDAAKFIVTSVPFITIKETDYSEYWSAEAFIYQKEELLSFIKSNNIGKTVFLTGQGNAAIHSTLNLKKNNGEMIVLHELMCGPLSHYQAGISNYDDFIWTQRTRNGELDYEYNVVSGNGETDPNVMSISLIGNELTYKVYSTRYDLNEEETPPVILDGKITL
ncbi:MAG: alkaline phosphatase D family protein [Bacteroidota bacterium]